MIIKDNRLSENEIIFKHLRKLNFGNKESFNFKNDGALIKKKRNAEIIVTNDIITESIDFFKDDGASFIKSMNTSYWNINKYHLALHLENAVIPFAIDVDNKDAKKIINELLKFKK